MDNAPFFVSAEDNNEVIEQSTEIENNKTTNDVKRASFVVSYEIDPLTRKDYALPDRRLYPDKPIRESGSYDSIEKALMAYSQVPEGGKKTFTIEWDNNVVSDNSYDYKNYDPMNFVEFEIMSGENGYSQIHKVPDEVIEQNGSMEMLHSAEYKDIFNRLEQYVGKEEMAIPKAFFIGVEETKNNEAYVQTAIMGNNIECKFYDNYLNHQRNDLIPFANTNADLFKATLLSYIADTVEAYGNPLIAVDFNKFNEIVKEAEQRDCFRKLGIDENLLDALDKIDWSVNVVKTDFFYDVEFTSHKYKLNAELYMNVGDSLNDKLQPIIKAHIDSKSPYSEEISKEYQTEFKTLGNVVKKWDKDHTRSVNAQLKEFGKEVSKQPKKTKTTQKEEER